MLHNLNGQLMRRALTNLSTRQREPHQPTLEGRRPSWPTRIHNLLGCQWSTLTKFWTGVGSGATLLPGPTTNCQAGSTARPGSRPSCGHSFPSKWWYSAKETRASLHVHSQMGHELHLACSVGHAGPSIGMAGSGANPPPSAPAHEPYTPRIPAGFRPGTADGRDVVNVGNACAGSTLAQPGFQAVYQLLLGLKIPRPNASSLRR